MAKKKHDDLASPTPAQLHAQVMMVDAARQAALDSIKPIVADLYEAYFDQVRTAIAEDADLGAAEAVSLANATAVMNDLERILIDAGLHETVNSFAQEFVPLSQAAAAFYEPYGVEASLSGVSSQTLAAFVDFSSTELTKVVDAALISPVRSALLQSSLGVMTQQQLVASITALQPGVTTNDVLVAVDNAYAQFQRGIIVSKGEALGLQVYQFLGPDDAITSPQCQFMLHVKTHGAQGFLYKDEIVPALIEKWIDGWNPLIGGGHPRCRHAWTPVTLAYAQAQGFKARTEDADAA